MIVVADTSPVNYLVLINRIGVLPLLFDEIAIPTAVHAQLTRAVAPAPVRNWIASPPAWLRILSPSRTAPDPDLDSLGPGESEAIVLAQEIGASEIIIDEKLGRRAAIRRGIVVTGTLGVSIKAADNGYLDLDETLRQLQATSFRFSPELIDRIRKSAT